MNKYYIFFLKNKFALGSVSLAMAAYTLFSLSGKSLHENKPIKKENTYQEYKLNKGSRAKESLNRSPGSINSDKIISKVGTSLNEQFPDSNNFLDDNSDNYSDDAQISQNKNDDGSITDNEDAKNLENTRAPSASFSIDDTTIYTPDAENKKIEKYALGVPTTKNDASDEENEESEENIKRATTSSSSSTPKVKGKIPPLLGLVTSLGPSFIDSAYSAASSCVNPKITIFDIKTMNVLADNPISEDTLKSDTYFEFDPYENNLNIERPTNYLLKTSGCDINYERIVTTFYADQDLTPTSTLISKIIKSAANVNFDNLNGVKVDNLINSITSTTTSTGEIENSYNVLDAQVSFQSSFSDIFDGESYSLLADAAPDLTTINSPLVLNEKSASTYSVQTQHWNPSYITAYEWHIDGSKLSNSSSWNYTPSANSKNSIILKLFIGKSVAGIGADVDRSLPFHELTYNLNVNDTFPVTAPAIALNSGSTNPTQTNNISIDLNTGADLGGYFQNCETFSDFAILEASAVPIAANFTYSCTNAVTQVIPHTLISPDGDIDVNIWARDINGAISTKNTFTVRLDASAPTITIAAMPVNHRADTIMTINWTTLEANQTAANLHSVEFFDGSSWTSLPDVASGNGFLNNQAFFSTYLLPNIQVANAKFRIGLTDSVGNSTLVESNSFAITKPILATTPNSFNYGSVLNNSTGVDNIFTISNTGDASTKGCSLVALSGANASEFSIATDNCASNTLAASSSCNVTIKALPTSKGAKNATATWNCDLDSTSTSLSYTSQNNLPTVPVDYAISTSEDNALNFTANAGADIDGDSLTYIIVTNPTNGTLTNCMASNADLTCTYTPNLNFFGSDTFSYKVNDATADSSSNATVTITVNPVNDAPTLSATQTINVTEDTLLNFSLNMGSDVDLDTLSYIITQYPAAGTLTCSGGTSTSCSYNPAPDDIATYTFKYKVNDGSLDSSEATVTININNTNDAPVMLGDQSVSTNEDTLVSFTLNGATDIDPAQTIGYKIITQPTNGVLSNCITTAAFTTDISCDYTPNLNFFGSDSFSYRANDGVADSATLSIVTITVNPINDAPTLSSPQNISTNEDTVLNFNLALGSDIEGDTLTYIKLSDPASGTLTCTGGTSRACSFTPALNFNGPVSFTYKVNDGSLDSNIATVNITVNAVNDAPTLSTPQAVATNEDTVLNFNLGLGADIEGDTLTYIKVSDPASGTLTCTGGTSQACSFTPALNFNGLVSFTYKVNDGSLDSNIATVNITVNPINDAPTLSTPQAVATNEDTVLNFNLGLGADIDGDTLTYIKVSDPASGTLNCTGGTSRACVYTPALNFNGLVSFTYKVNDGSLDSNTATVNITVNPINDRPVMAANQVFATDDNALLSFTISNATDIDGDSLSYKIISNTSNGVISNCITTGSYGTDLTCNYQANANFNGADSFTYIANDGTIDAITTATITINVSDKTPSAPPAIALAHTQYRNVMGQNLTASSCSDIGHILINEGTQPSAGSASWQTCSTTAAAITYTLATSSQGTHNLKAWSKDAQGNVSLTATNIVVIYDTVLPVIAVTNPGLQRGANTITVDWTVTELNISAAQNHTIQYFDGATWINITTTKPASAGPLSSAAFSNSWTTPSLNRVDIKLRVILTDLAGNTATSDSTAFEIDSTAPALSFSTPAANSYHQSSATVTGLCQTGLNVNFSGDIPASFNQMCSGGTFSQLVNFTSGDGNKTITISQTDLAGNITAVSRILIRDEIAPILAKTSGLSPDFTRFNQPNTWGGTCEGNYTINVTGSQITSFLCTAGTWTWTPSAKTVDGTFTYNLVQTDGAGNTSSPPLSLSWQRDATPPIFAVSSPISIPSGSNVTITNNLDTITLDGSCEGTNPINVSGATTAVFSCSSSSWTWTSPSITSDGTRTFTFTQNDPAGNTSVITVNHTRDTTGPALTIALNTIKNNENTVTLSGNCENGETVNITGAQTSSTTCSGGTWIWTSSSETIDSSRAFTVSQSFSVSPFNTTSVNATWIRETDLPTISLFTTSSSSPSRTAFIPIDLNATSQNPEINLQSLCIKSDDTTTPLFSDSCWIDFNSPTIGQALSQTVVLDDYTNLLGWVPKNYEVYVWVKDEAQNISDLSNSGLGTIGSDKLDMAYDPGIPPQIWDVLAANTPHASLPPTRAQSSVSAGNDLYIRWKTSDNITLPTGAITLYYTPDEINFTQIISGLDVANYGCTGYTLAANEGCYKWTGGSPLNTTYKIQVKTTDAGDIATQLTSNLINSDMIKIIAGNTESGLGGSAQTALFFTRNNGSEADPGTLVVTNNGRFYIADYKRGIITIDPADGKQKIFIPGTGTSSGDGGAAVNATLRYATKIALDYQGRLLILDTDRIRRVDLNQSTPSIETIIGGGADSSDTVSNPLDVNIYAHSANSWTARGTQFFAMPNGDIYFQSDYGIANPGIDLRIRIYKASTGQVISKIFTGTGDSYDSLVDLKECRLQNPGIQFDPLTSQVTALSAVSFHHNSYVNCDNNPASSDGELYTMANFDPITFQAIAPTQDNWASHYYYFNATRMDGFNYRMITQNYIDRINFDGTHTRIVGSGTRGYCIDGTTATACNMSIQDIFITPAGKIYLLEGGQIRTVDENGNMVTLFGQRPSYGDGVNALNARFEKINAVKRLNNGKYIVGDYGSYFIKEFTTEGTINIIAGDGNQKSYQNTSTPATSQGFYDGSWFAVDQSTGDVFTRAYAYGEFVKLNRITGFWEDIIGRGGTETYNYWQADGHPGLSLISNGNQSYGLPLGFDGQNLLIIRMKYNNTETRWEDFMLKLYDTTDSYKQSHLAGTNGVDTYTGGYEGICASGSLAATCKIPYYSYIGFPFWDTENSRWIFTQNQYGGTTGRNIYSAVKGGNITKIATLARYTSNGYTYIKPSSTEYLYYCSSGKIYQHNLSTNTDMGALTWPTPNLSCAGMSLEYNPTNNSLVFPFVQNGLFGIAEYFLP